MIAVIVIKIFIILKNSFLGHAKMESSAEFGRTKYMLRKPMSRHHVSFPEPGSRKNVSKLSKNLQNFSKRLVYIREGQKSKHLRCGIKIGKRIKKKKNDDAL